MVRLKYIDGTAGITVTAAFQFHYGSIKMERQVKESFGSAGFNSTMVRLKYTQNFCFAFDCFVSIPLWFD